jgi:DNA-binding SARP family transcriptional activator
MLLKITAGSALLEPMSLPLEEDIDTHFLYTNLYYSPKQEKLFVLMNKTGVDNIAEITIYSMNYPPIPVADLSQQPPTAAESESSSGWWRILLVVPVALITGGVYFFRKRRHMPGTKREIVQPQIKKDKEDKRLLGRYDFSKRCVCFLGGFHVRDKEGNDITSAFSPTLKMLLILLVLYTEMNERGIPSHKMLQLLWSDKDENSARNNRNVYLSKLRTLLERTGNIDVLTEGGFWTIKIGEDVTCDYTEAMRFFKNLKKEQPYDEEQFNKLLELLLRGTLLPNTEVDWIDRFKSDFSNLTIDTLSSLLTTDSGISNDLKLKISETLFQHDFINEDALHVKCKILSESGKVGLAKNFYDNYCKEYHNLLGTSYKYSLSEVLRGKNRNL